MIKLWLFPCEAVEGSFSVWHDNTSKLRAWQIGMQLGSFGVVAFFRPQTSLLLFKVREPCIVGHFRSWEPQPAYLSSPHSAKVIPVTERCHFCWNCVSLQRFWRFLGNIGPNQANARIWKLQVSTWTAAAWRHNHLSFLFCFLSHSRVPWLTLCATCLTFLPPLFEAESRGSTIGFWAKQEATPRHWAVS